MDNQIQPFAESENEKLSATIGHVLIIVAPFILIYAAFYFWLGYILPAIIDVLHAGLALVVYGILRRKQVSLGLVIIFSGSALAAGLHTYLHGLYAGYPAYFFMLLVALVVFRPYKLNIQWVLVAMAAVVVFVAALSNISSTTVHYPLTETYRRVVLIGNMFTSLSIIFLMLVNYRLRTTKIEKQLFQNQQLLESTFNSSPNAFLLVDNKGQVVFRNAVSGENKGLFFRKPVEKGDSLAAILPDATYATLAEITEKAIKGETIDRNISTKETDSERYINVRANPVYGLGHEVSGVFLTLSDVTQQHLDDLNNQRMALVAAHTDNAVIITDVDGRIEWVNKAFEDTTGYTYEEVIGQIPGKLLQGPDTDAATVKRMGDKIKAHLPVHEEILNYTKNGESYWLDLSIQPVFNDEGLLVNYIAIERDITAEKQAREDLTRSQALLNAINQNIKDALFRSTWEGDLRYVNATFYQLFKLDPSTALGDINVASLHTDRDSLVAFMQKIEENGYAENVELEMRAANGHTFWGAISAQVLHDGNGQRVIDGSIRDISEVRKARQELIVAKEKAEEASQVKADFLSTMSHEIRTPMNAVIGMTELLLMEDPRPDQTEHLNILKFSGQNLLDLINDILDYSKIEAGRIELEEEEINLMAIAKSILQGMRPKAEEKNIDIILEVSEDLPRFLMGDATRISQVLSNLVGNALKFTEEGSVTLRMDVQHIYKDKVDVLVEVIDTGIGIPPDKIDAIFEQFSQANNSITRKYGGTGLGLSITKRLLELMQTEIKVMSEVDKGSTFSFVLSLGRSRQENLLTQAELDGETEITLYHHFKDLRVLLVEDNLINTKLALRFLQKWGITAETAENGAIAVTKARENTYDLIFMDLQMPVMNGYEATHAIRKFDAVTPILALTASALIEAQQKILKAGMNDSVIKPINPMDFNRKIKRYVSSTKVVN